VYLLLSVYAQEESLERLRKLESMLGVKHDEELLRMPELTRNEDSEGGWWVALHTT
jgi:hypothetical protein